MEMLSSKETLIILTTAPTGLGHLRVMDALIDGLPKKAKWVEIGLNNLNAAKIHALGSRIPFLIKLTEFYQTNNLAELVVSSLYLSYIRNKSFESEEYFKNIFAKYPEKKVWVILCTHFNLAHAIAARKERLEKKYKVKILLCTVVTDDSPQRVWAVSDADLIFVPSEQTRIKLSKFITNKKILKVVSFPISPWLLTPIPKDIYQKIFKQLEPGSKKRLRIQIPISGAAVQLDFFKKLIKTRLKKSASFTIIAQKTSYTQSFIKDIGVKKHITVLCSPTNRGTVNLYEAVLQRRKRSSLEITKPSEQVFKSILKPTQTGGVLLLLTPPIGRQEKDNLNFLRRHGLMPSLEEEKELLTLFSKKNSQLDSSQQAVLLYKASHWRAINLPYNPSKAADFILFLRKMGILYAMLSYTRESAVELSGEGVKDLWQEVENKLQTIL